MAIPACINCGLPLVQNHHPDAGKPLHINTVGCPTGCLPCTEKRANGRQKVIAAMRIWLEDQASLLIDTTHPDFWDHPNDMVRHEVLNEVLSKLNELEEQRRVAYHASRIIDPLSNGTHR
jgi:hypothetical protein